MRSCYSNFFKSSVTNVRNSLALESSGLGHRLIEKCPTTSLWFTKFMNGLVSRMGETHKPNLALTTTLIKETLCC